MGEQAAIAQTPAPQRSKEAVGKDIADILTDPRAFKTDTFDQELRSQKRLDEMIAALLAIPERELVIENLFLNLESEPTPSDFSGDRFRWVVVKTVVLAAPERALQWALRRLKAKERDIRYFEATYVAQQLGEDAHEALPELLADLAGQVAKPRPPWHQMQINALVAVGPQSEAAMNTLAKFAENWSSYDQKDAVRQLALFGEPARAHGPLLESLIKVPAPSLTQYWAAFGLVTTGLGPDRGLKLLVEFVRSEGHQRRYSAIEALEELGELALPAVPELRAIAETSIPDKAKRLERAIKTIELSQPCPTHPHVAKNRQALLKARYAALTSGVPDAAPK